MEVVLTGCAVVAIAAGVRRWVVTGLPRTSALVMVVADGVQLLIVYAAVFRITASILPAAAAALVVALSPAPMAEPPLVTRRAATSALHILALLAVLRAVDLPGPLTLLEPVSLVAVALVALLYWADSSTTALFVVCAGVLGLVSHDPRFVVLALAGVPVALVLARALRRESTPLTLTLCMPPEPPISRLGRAMRLIGQNSCFIVLLALPGSQIPGAQLMSWWATGVVGWTLLTTLARRFRHFSSTLPYLQLSVAPTAVALALSLNEQGGISPLRPSPATLAVACCAVLSVVMRGLPPAIDPAALTRHGLSFGLSQVLTMVRARRRLMLSVLLFSLSFVVFQGDFRYQGNGDTKPAELLPIALLEDHSPTFDRFAQVTNDRNYFWGFMDINGHMVSAYPIVPGLVNTPVYALAAWSGANLTESAPRLSAVTAALVSAGSVALMFAVLLNLFQATWTALLGASVYAFGTCVWSVASKAMWQHGPSLLFLLGALALLTSRAARKWLWLAGILLGLAIWNRPTNVVFGVAITGWWLWQEIAPDDRAGHASHRGIRSRRRHLADLRQSLVLLIGIAGPGVAMLVYSWVYLGRVDTFGQLQTFDTFRGDLLVGLLGLLISPSRGLLVMSPILLLSVVGAIVAVHGWRTHRLGVVLLAAVLVELLIYAKWSVWWGGASFGYRIILETVPALVILAAIGWQAWAQRVAVRVAVVAPLAVAFVYIQWLGATYYGCGFNAEPNLIDDHPERLWDVANGEIARCTTKALIATGVIRPGVSGPTSLGRSGLSAALDGVQLPSVVHSDSQISIEVTAHNTGQATWLTEPPGLIGVDGVVGVSVRAWRGADGKLFPVSNDSTAHVPRNVDPGQSARVTVQTRTPRDPGRYDLVLDVLSERVTWFGDVNDGTGTVVPVVIED